MLFVVSNNAGMVHKAKPEDNDEVNEYLMTSGVARELEISGQGVIGLNKRGVLPAIRTASGVRLYRRADVERLKAERQQRKALSA